MPNHIAYAEKHGYRYEHAPFPDGQQAWPKLDALIDNLHYGRVLWIDADAIFTDMNVEPHYPLGLQSGLTMSVDINGPCAGVMWLRNCPLLQMLLHTCRDHRSLFEGHPWSDQAALRHFIALPPYDTLVQYSSDRQIDYSLYPGYSNLACLTSMSWTPQSFIFHAAGLPVEVQLAAIKERNPIQ